MLGLAAAMLLAGAALLPATSKSAALVIDHGGTYTGEYASDDPRVPVILITTPEPVVIDRATLRGAGYLIVSATRHADITVRNTIGVGRNPNIAGRATGRFASLERFNRVTVENCSMEGTSGIYLLDYAGDGSDKQSVRIVGNRAKNIDGRKSDGKGGYTGDRELVQFVQLDKVRHLAGAEIAWNDVMNEPGKSAVEDNISVYLSSGAANSPIRIHDNFIRGAYPNEPVKDSFSGGGIMLGDGVGKSADDDSSFVEAFENHVVDTVNYGVAISAGHDCTMYRNRILSAGVLSDGRSIAAQNVGAYVWDSYKAGPSHFFNNGGHDNLIGWVKGGGRNDWWRPGATSWENNSNWPDPITVQLYESEHNRWTEKARQAGVTIGPIETASSPPASTWPASTRASH
jgi:hypothetical protein